jgi:hypothetical protein
MMAEALAGHKSRSVKIMLLLVESGAIFCVFQVVGLVGYILSATLSMNQLQNFGWLLSTVALQDIFVIVSVGNLIILLQH